MINKKNKNRNYSIEWNSGDDADAEKTNKGFIKDKLSEIVDAMKDDEQVNIVIVGDKTHLNYKGEN